jgi:hypothetical protein
MGDVWLSGDATGPSRKTGCRHDYAMRRNDGRGFESHATAEKYNGGHLISARTPSTASVVNFHTATQMQDLGMLL